MLKGPKIAPAETAPSRRSFHGLIAALLLAAGGAVLWSLMKPAPAGLSFYGNVDIREVDLAFRQAGRLTRMAFEEGDNVAAGSELATLDAVPFEQRREEAKALLQKHRPTSNDCPAALGLRKSPSLPNL